MTLCALCIGCFIVSPAPGPVRTRAFVLPSALFVSLPSRHQAAEALVDVGVITPQGPLRSCICAVWLDKGAPNAPFSLILMVIYSHTVAHTAQSEISFPVTFHCRQHVINLPCLRALGRGKHACGEAYHCSRVQAKAVLPADPPSWSGSG